MSKYSGRGGRMDRQTSQKNLRQSLTELEAAKGNLEDKKYWAAKAESYLERMREGFSEGSKLYYDSFKTRAMLTTGSILVILALTGNIVPVNPTYSPILWISCGLLLFSMVAALKTMDSITGSVFTWLTKERPPEEAKITGAIEEGDELKAQREKDNKRLRRQTTIASGSFVSGISTFLFYVILPPLVGYLGVVGAIVVCIAVVLVIGTLYRWF